MKKILFFAAVAAMFAACSKDMTQDVAVIPDGKLYARIESPESRISLSDGDKTTWEDGDIINLFYGNIAYEKWRYNGQTGSTEGYFTKTTDGVKVSCTYDKLIATHGQVISDQDTDDIRVRLYQIQTYPEIAPMIAIEELGSKNLLFKNVVGFIRISLRGDKSVERITLRGNDGEVVCGLLTVDYETLECATAENRTECSIKCMNPVPLSESESAAFDIAVIPQTFEKGFSIYVNFSDGTNLKKSTDKSITVERNHIVPMSGLEYNAIPKDEIWYTSTNNRIVTPYKTDVFGANIVSNTYLNGKGVIKFDSPVTEIGTYAFCNCYTLKTVTLPDDVADIGDYAFLYCSNLSAFYGKYSSIDDRCLIINGKLVAFAKAGLTEYTIPYRTREIGDNAFYGCYNLIDIAFPQTLRTIGRYAFAGCSGLKSIKIPSSVNTIKQSAFQNCTGIESFSGNSGFVSDDNLFITADSDGKPDKTTISAFANGSKRTSYTIPEGISNILFGAFMGNTDLQRITFPSTITGISSSAFLWCDNLEYIYGDCASSDNKCAVIDRTTRLFAGKGIKNYTVPDGVKFIGIESFAAKQELENIIVNDNVTEIDDFAFANCPNLKSITISANAKSLGYDPFEGSTNLTSIFCRAQLPPALKSVYETEYGNLTIYVPEQSLDAYLNSSDWQPYRKYIAGYEYTDLPESEIYVSSDYSADGKVAVMQKATKGNGIDIVLMGDAFSDRQIADGTYDATIQQALDYLFTEEPYRSFRDMFNIYKIYVVSESEGYGIGRTALSGYFGSGTYVGGNDTKCFEYAQKAISQDRMDNALIVVMMNSRAYAGTCYMYYPASGDFGCGISVAYFPLGQDRETFASTLHHEACGHGFAKLDDEYAYEYMGAIPADAIAQHNYLAQYGWHKNTDLTNDPATVKWHVFLSDSRYAYDGLGVFEGGSTYWSGVWRPTENSIMRYNTGGFNAPSREAIYYRIHKLAYGESWNYDYEDFVAYDAVNRKTSASAVAFSTPLVPKDFVPLAPPVIINKSWRDAE